MYVTSTVASEYYGVSFDTLRRWDKKGKLSAIRTKGNHRRYFIPDNKKSDRRKIIYARVSSSKQKPHLQNQIKYLQKKYPKYELITDVGSGINFNRSGFREILVQINKIFNKNLIKPTLHL